MSTTNMITTIRFLSPPPPRWSPVRDAVGTSSAAVS